MNLRLPLRFTTLALLCVATPASADTPPDWISEMFSRVPQEAPADLMSREGQDYIQTLPSVGREDIHSTHHDWPIRPRVCNSLPDARDPIDEIAALARDTRVVIVNEGHDRPRHRDFTRQIAIALKPLGYTRFAAETFRDSVVESRERRFPRAVDGYYSNEPVFGGLVREVLALDYLLEAYEYRGNLTDSDPSNPWTVADRREEGQANNLARIIESMDDGERILVHVGYSHAAEVPIPSFGGNELAWMAARLLEKTGIDPLTIDQTDCESSQPATVLTAASDRHVEGQFDLVVGHPPLGFERGRPVWRMQDRTAVEIPSAMRSDSERVLVEARPYGEPSYTVPVDRLMLWQGEDIPLLLEEGRYALTAWFETSGESRSATLLVD